MNLKLLLSICIFAFSLNSVSASFPVKRQIVNSESSEIIEVAPEDLETPMAYYRSYDKWVAVVLWAFLWPLAAHRWYAHKPVGYNILFILTLGGLFVWAVIDLVHILQDRF